MLHSDWMMAKTRIGGWAVCRRGFVGNITEIKDVDGRALYLGYKVDGTPWQSVEPTFISDPAAKRALEQAFALTERA